MGKISIVLVLSIILIASLSEIHDVFSLSITWDLRGAEGASPLDGSSSGMVPKSGVTATISCGGIADLCFQSGNGFGVDLKPSNEDRPFHIDGLVQTEIVALSLSSTVTFVSIDVSNLLSNGVINAGGMLFPITGSGTIPINKVINAGDQVTVSSNAQGFGFSFDSFTVETIDSSPVGGKMLPIDTTSLLASGAHYTVSWFIPFLVSAIGFGILIISRKHNRN